MDSFPPPASAPGYRCGFPGSCGPGMPFAHRQCLWDAPMPERQGVHVLLDTGWRNFQKKKMSWLLIFDPKLLKCCILPFCPLVSFPASQKMKC